jgi:hypothetical protein
MRTVGGCPQNDEDEEPDFLRLRAFFAWCMIFAVLGVFALWHGLRTLLRVALFPFGIFRKG